MMTMGYSRKNSNEGCNTCWNFKGQKPRPMEILHEFFLNLTTSWGNSTSFYCNWCWEFLHALSLVTLETPCLQQPICLESFWNSPVMEIGSNGNEIASPLVTLLLFQLAPGVFVCSFSIPLKIVCSETTPREPTLFGFFLE